MVISTVAHRAPTIDARPYEHELFELARNLVGDRMEASHLLDETYLCSKSPDTNAPSTDLRTLEQCLQQTITEQHDQHRLEIVWEEVGPKWQRPDYTVRLKQVVDALADRAELEQALTRLPFIYRSVLVLHDVEGWTQREIASGQNLGVATVAERILRGRMMVVSAFATGAERSVLSRHRGHNCAEIRGEFAAYMDGSLLSKKRISVERHLRQCLTCPPLHAAIVATREAFSALGQSSEARPRRGEVQENKPPVMSLSGISRA